MSLIDKIELLKLAPYDGNAWKSFEMLCYVLASREYPHEHFTAVNGAGGDGGVEFYITKSNGREIGWQCKFFQELGDSQKTQISRSLKSVEKNHGSKLDEWFVCTPIDFTPKQIEWFEKLGKGKKFKISHWGQSKIIDLLTKYPDLIKFFFNSELFDNNWFAKHSELVMKSSIVKTKYIPDTHSETYAEEWSRLFFDTSEILMEFENNHRQIVFDNKLDLLNKQFDKVKSIAIEKSGIDFDLYHSYELFISHVSQIGECIEKIRKSLHNADWPKVKENSRGLGRLYNETIPLSNCLAQELREDLPSISMTISRIIRYVKEIYGIVYRCSVPDLHIVGGASLGKSHLAIDLFQKHHTEKGRKPSVLVLARQLNPASGNLKRMILENLGLDNIMTFDDFLSALDIAGRINKCKSLLIVDGLNEAFGLREVWNRDLEKLIHEVGLYPNVLLTLTYRMSYRPYLGLQEYFKKKSHQNRQIKVQGLDSETIKVAINKYLNHSGITIYGEIPEWLQIFFSENPLMISLFCSIYEGQHDVRINESSILELFELFLKKCNDRFIEGLKKDPTFEKHYFEKKLDVIAAELWHSNERIIPADRMTALLNLEEIRLLDSEELLVMRELSSDTEEFSFTFDLLGGYVIANWLLKNINSVDELRNLINSEEVQTKLILKSDNNHALRDVILDSLLKLSVAKLGFFIDEQFKMPSGWLINALVNCKADNIKNSTEDIKEYVIKSLHDNPRRLDHISTYHLNDPHHPLNLARLTEIAIQLEMNVRDLSWTEALRVNDNLRKAIDRQQELSIMTLTSTIVSWRINMIRRFYTLALLQPDKFVDEFRSSFGIDDPYVQEGLLAAVYGAVLARQDMEDPLIYPMAKALTEAIECDLLHFDHYLIRDYARLILLLAKRKGYDLDIATIRKMYRTKEEAKSVINLWTITPAEKYPLMSDFSNYTLGHIIPDGGAYSNPPLKQKARGFIMEEIDRIGWSEECFANIDREIMDLQYSRSNIEGKVERYGKKYAWIGYYKAASVLQDAEMLDKEYNKWRVPEVNYDCTFPQFGVNVQLDIPELLSPKDIDNAKWMKIPFSKDLCKGVTERLFEDEEFICIYAGYSEKDETQHRKTVVFLTSMIVDSSQTDKFIELLPLNKNDFHYRSPLEITNPFGGEFDCWENTVESSEVVVSLETGETVEYEEEITQDNIFESLIMADDEPVEIGSKVKRIGKPIQEFNVLYPLIVYLNEKDIDSGHYYYLIRSLKSDLKLLHNPNSGNLLDSEGKEALKLFQYSPQTFEGMRIFVYLRKDLLQNWLKEHNKNLVTLAWGEKEFWEEQKDRNERPIHHFEYFSQPVYKL